MEKLYLIVRIAGELVAFDANQVGSVVEVDSIAPVPRVPEHIAGLFALRSRVLTVICTQAALGFGRAEKAENSEAVVIQLDGHSYALLVDAVEDVAAAGAVTPLAALVGKGWNRVAIGQLVTDHGTLLLVDPARLIAGVEELAA
jgi:purine-binding chemotaxis protein CheW